MKSVDVVIVGAGPVGLLLALELSLAGVSCVVLEARAGPEDVQKALSLGPLGAEALQRRGMGPVLDALEKESQARMAPFMALAGGGWGRQGRSRGAARRFSGHFAGIPLLAQPQDEQRPTRLIDQRLLQDALRREVEKRGIEIRSPCRLTDLDEQENALVLTLDDGNSGRAERIKCHYAVGCDGARSTMRRLGGFAFAGVAPTLSFYQVFVEFASADQIPLPGWQMQPGGVMAYGPVPGRLFLIDYSGPPPMGQTVPTREQVEGAIEHVCGYPVPLAAYEGGRVWTDHTRLVDQYRRGRVFLAGDAAHIHPPFGGQGLGLGLCDAANLGWKLGAVLAGHMPAALLESYESERRPVARNVLENTRAQTALMRPDPQSRALHGFMAEMLSRDEPCAALGAQIKGYALRYAGMEEKTDPASAASQPCVLGALVGDQVLADGRTLFSLMQNGQGVLLLPEGASCARPDFALPHRIVLGISRQDQAALMRPDGCLVWQGRPDDHDGLDRAIERWFAVDHAA